MSLIEDLDDLIGGAPFLVDSEQKEASRLIADTAAMPPRAPVTPTFGVWPRGLPRSCPERHIRLVLEALNFRPNVRSESFLMNWVSPFIQVLLR